MSALNQNEFWMARLPQIRSLIYVFAFLSFLILNWGETRLMVEFVSTSYFSDLHGQDFKKLYSYPDYDRFNIGRNIGRLFICAGAAIVIDKLLTALIPFWSLNERELSRREKSIQRRVRQLDQIEHTLGLSEQFSKHIVANVNEVNRLTEHVLKLRL